MKSLYRMVGGLLVFFYGVQLSLCLIVFCLCVMVERGLVELLECWARRVADEQKGDSE